MTTYARPLASAVTQGFGAGKELSWQLGHGHLGTDFGCATNTPVKAVGAGMVLWADWGTAGLQHRSWEARWYLIPEYAGICVVIDHGTHISIYGHLIRTDLNIGDRVAVGQVIGLSGSTGLSLGPHLHLEMLPKPINYSDGTYGRRDPLAIIAASAVAAPPVAVSNTLVGIDISLHQAGINVGATGAQFAVVKASEGVGYTDPHYANNIASARRAGVLVGHYHLSRFGAQSGNTPEAEAAWFIEVMKPQLANGDLVFLDLELDDLNPAVAKRFLDIVSAATNRKCLIYMNLSTASAPGWEAVKSIYPLWLAQYPSNAPSSWSPVAAVPQPAGWNVAIWQHTQTGRLAGYNGNLDLNVFYGSRAAWDALAGGKGFTPVVAPAPAKKPAEARIPANLLVVHKGDTFSGIAKQFNLDLNAFKAANPGINYELIHPGDLLKVPAKTAVARPVTTGVTQCIVEPGDTFTGIAAQFKVDLNAFKAANPGLDYDRIFPGQVLNLPKPVAAPPKAPAKPAPKKVTQCIVESGDTLTSIAAQFNTTVARLIAANPGINPHVIHPGQVLNL